MTVRRRRWDSGQQSGRRPATEATITVDPESESTVWIDRHEERSDSIVSYQSGGRISFSIRPSVSSRPSQFDEIDIDVGQYANDGEKVYVNVYSAKMVPYKVIHHNRRYLQRVNTEYIHQ